MKEVLLWRGADLTGVQPNHEPEFVNVADHVRSSSPNMPSSSTFASFASPAFYKVVKYGMASSEGMDVLPEAVQHYILGFIRNSRDVAACICVSRQWKEAMTQARSLDFARNIADEPGIVPDEVVSRMVRSSKGLRELKVYCPFSDEGLRSWLTWTKDTLQVLELRVDDLCSKSKGKCSLGKLSCVDVAVRLRTLRLWGVFLTGASPDWRSFQELHTLEIVGARLRTPALSHILVACPMLTRLTLLGCEGIRYQGIALKRLTHCRLDFYGAVECRVKIIAPCLEFLEVQGVSGLLVEGDHRLRHLSVANNAGQVRTVEVGRLPELQVLSLRGVHWQWEAVNAVLQAATEITKLSMRVEFCGEDDVLAPFPEIDFVDFFNSHPKLRTLEVQGAMFAAISNKTSLRQLSPTTLIPSLEDVRVTVRSPLNAEQKLASLAALARCSPRLRRLRIRLSQMKNCDRIADEFFLMVQKLKLMYNFIMIE